MTADDRKRLAPLLRELGAEADVPEGLAGALDAALGAPASPPGAPPGSLRGRLLAAVSAGPMRLAPMFERMGRLFDLSREAIVKILEQSQSAGAWEPGPHPAIRVMHFAAGPALVGGVGGVGADTGLVRMPAGFAWPRHRHVGAEKVLILEGQYTDSEGRVYRPGDLHEMSAGTEHGFVVGADQPLLLAVVLHGGIEILG